MLLIVFGALAVVALQNYEADVDNNRNEVIFDKMREIRTAINTYVINNGFYPCPANPYLDSQSQFYAKGARDINGNCQIETECDTTEPGGSAPNEVLCYENPSFDRTNASANYNISLGDFIMGAVPCEDLGLNRDCMLTPDGQKIAYVTSAHLAKSIPCSAYISTTGGLISAYYKLKLLQNFNSADNLVTNYTNFKMFASPADEAEYLLWYAGSDNIGAWTKEGTRITGTSVSSGGFINDNLYQQINHNINTSSQLDEYFIVPAQPLDTPTGNLTSTNPKIVFGDIILYGKATDLEIPKKICLDCKSCNAAWQNRVVRLDSFTNCTTTSPVASNGVNGLCD